MMPAYWVLLLIWVVLTIWRHGFAEPHKGIIGAANLALLLALVVLGMQVFHVAGPPTP
jgi:hypothetical protein